MQDEQSGSAPFDKWLERKTIQRGIQILQSIKVDHMNITKEEVENELMLAALAIDCSCSFATRRRNRRSAQKSMKHNLLQWMCKHHSFDCVRLNEQDRGRFSLTGYHINNVSEDPGGGLILCSCSYVNIRCDDQIEKDEQKIVNTLYLQNFERKWEECMHRLHENCQSALCTQKKVAAAEPKIAYSFAQLSMKDNAYEEETKKTQRCNSTCSESKPYDPFYESKGLHATKVSTCNSEPILSVTPKTSVLAGAAYGVSESIFRKYLHSFGIKYLTNLQEKSIHNETAKIIADKQVRERDAKRAHEKWVDLKCREGALKYKKQLDIRRNQLEKEKAHAKRELDEKRFFAKRTESGNSKRISHEVQRPKHPRKPRLWAVASSTDNNCICINWSSEDDIEFFSLSVYKEGGKKPSKTWRDPETSNADFLLQRTFYLDPGDKHLFGASCVSKVGSSPEVRIEVIAKPTKPGIPVLVRQASCKDVDICWQSAEQSKINDKNRDSNNLLSNGNKRLVRYIVESCTCKNDSTREWSQIWKGFARDAKINGLTENSSYTFRIRAYIGEVSSLNSDTSTFHTMPRAPQRPRQSNRMKVDSTHSAALSWDKPTNWNTDNLRDSDYKKSLIGRGVLQLKHYISKVGGANNGQLRLSDFGNVLKILNVTMSVDTFNLLLKTVEGIYGSQMSEDQFNELWSTMTISNLYMMREQNGEKDIVYSGTDFKAIIDGLNPSTKYLFAVQHITLRGESRLSSTTTIYTHPEPPKSITVVQAYADEMIFKVQVDDDSKPLNKICLEMRDESDKKREWDSVFIGRVRVIKITKVRPRRKYKVKCFLLNEENVKSVPIYRTFESTPCRFLLDRSTLTTQFLIDCCGTNAIVEGDLILFTELMCDQAVGTNTMITEPRIPRTVVARVERISSDQKNCTAMKLEVCWVSTKSVDITVGSIVDKFISDICKYEVLRMQWVDEQYRIQSVAGA